MPKVMKICKVCGKEYEACHTPNHGVWRWRDVACCYEHGMQYLHDVQVARGEIVEEKVEPVVNDAACNINIDAEHSDFDVEEDTVDTEKVPATKRVRSRKK